MSEIAGGSGGPVNRSIGLKRAEAANLYEDFLLIQCWWCWTSDCEFLL